MWGKSILLTGLSHVKSQQFIFPYKQYALKSSSYAMLHIKTIILYQLLKNIQLIRNRKFNIINLVCIKYAD